MHVKVGDNAQDFGIHQGLLSEASSYFIEALSRDFREPREKIFRLREDDVKTFQHFHFWLYTGSVLDSDESLKSVRLQPLIELYNWATLRDVPKLQDFIIDMLQIRLLASLPIKAKPLDSALIHLVYKHTPKYSPLRELWTLYYSYLDDWRFQNVIAKEDATGDLPREFLHDVLFILKRRVNERDLSAIIARGYFVSGCHLHVHGEGALCAKSAF